MPSPQHSACRHPDSPIVLPTTTSLNISEDRKRKLVPGAAEETANKRVASMERIQSTGSSLDGGVHLDTNLYSRQIGAFGLETMGKLIKMRVLISGMNGAGVETAKNLILAGPHTVGIHDGTPARFEDLGSNFYLTEADVAAGKSRAEAVVDRLAELNDYVNTTLVQGELTPAVVSNYHVIVACNMKLSKQIELNSFCRSHRPPIGFVSVSTFGLACSLFVDFGDEFTIFDKTGDPPKEALIDGITQDNPGIVHLNEEKPCPFTTGDWVVFREIQGMTELNNGPPIQIRRVGKYSFSIHDTTSYSAYTREGIVARVNMPEKTSFLPLQTALDYPIPPGEHGLIEPDLGKPERSEQLHLASRSLCEYQELHGVLPAPRDASAVAECLATAKALNAAAAGRIIKDRNVERDAKTISVETVDADVVEKTVKFAACQLSPIAAFVGGIAAQEVVKFTGKFTPLRQFLYFDAFETLPAEDAAGDATPMGCRYDHQIAIWGRSFQQILGRLNMFVVGAGALGCEFVKSFALLGCCASSQDGCLTLTDMDRIEVSNLNRQFLFRRHHVGAPKSRTAAEAGQRVNPDLKVVGYETRVGVETEDVFDDGFWDSLDMVVNALDNVPSRLYIDGRCVWYGKPLLESGTLGTKANTQVILPKMTQSYGDSRDPPEESIPLCTLRHFPNQIEHTIEWSRDSFQGLFCDGPQEAKAFLEHVDGFLARLSSEGTASTQRSRLTKIHTLLTMLTSNPSFEQCIEWAVKCFASDFDHEIAQLLHTFPLDYVTSNGQPFWSGPKRAPSPITFSADDPLHLGFVMAAANLIAYNLGIDQVRDVNKVRALASKCKAPPFVPRIVSYRVDESDTTTVEGAGDDEFVKRKLEDELRRIAIMAHEQDVADRVNPVEFEKDDDSNFHIDFITTCANLRARNYRITECDRHKAKMIAGKIVPAIATTTAMITGLVSLELLKTVTYKDRPLSDFKNAFICIGTQFYCMTEPSPPIQTKDKEYDPLVCGPIRARPSGFTTWDVLHLVVPNGTVQDAIDAIQRSQNVEVSILSVGNICLYNGYLKSHRDRLPQNVKTLTESIMKCPLPTGRNYVALEASCSDADGVDVLIPTVKLVFAPPNN